MNKETVNRILAETPKLYDAIAADFSSTRGKWWEGFGDFAKFVAPSGRVLDLGCGNGRMAQLFEKASVEYLGLDNSQELVKLARSRFAGQDNFRFEMSDALDLQLPLANFDLALMIAMLHHIPTREHRLKILRDVYTALKPGGHLVISNWNLWRIIGPKKFRYYPYLFNYSQKIRLGASGFSDAFVPWKANLKQEDWRARYIHSFGKREMNKLLQQAGFTIESICYVGKSRGADTILTGDNLLAVAVKK